MYLSMMKHPLSCVLLLVSVFSAVMALSPSAARADEFDPKDNTIVLGERVGLIKPGMTSAEIERAYGKKNLKLVELPGPEGSTFSGAKLFEGTDRELEIAWNPEKEDRKVVSEVIVIGKAWTFANGLKQGMSLAEVEKINGKPFQVAGFGWDYGGYANFEGGKLEGKLSVRFDIKTDDYPDSVTGDRMVPSTHKALRALKPFVADRISVFMNL